MINKFRPQKYYDYEIVDAKEQVVGNIRVKPSSVLWAPKHSRRWYGVGLEDFATFMEREGTKQKK